MGLPNAGKSTALQRAHAGRRRDGRLCRSPLSTPTSRSLRSPTSGWARSPSAWAARELVPATIEFHDIAGLVRGASEGEGLGNQFLGAIRETDAICHVVRATHDSGVPHPDGRVDPLRDVETIEAELLLADLEQAERTARAGDEAGPLGRQAEAIAERDWLERVVAALERGEPVRSVPVPDARRGARHRSLHALTSKPVLYVANVDEGDDRGARGGRRPRRAGTTR